MKIFRIVFLLFLCLLCHSHKSYADDNNPVEDERAMVVEGNARFTILTSQLLRMEWNENAVFEDL